MVRHGNYPTKSSVMFLPMTDMSSSEVTCIFSTFKYVCEHTRRRHQSSRLSSLSGGKPSIMIISISKNVGSNVHEIVLRFGGFHTKMVFFWCIGRLMAGTELSEMLELEYDC